MGDVADRAKKLAEQHSPVNIGPSYTEDDMMKYFDDESGEVCVACGGPHFDCTDPAQWAD
jgi:hypothetical protein